MQTTHLSRRQFLRMSALGSGAVLLAACAAPTPEPTATPAPPTATPVPPTATPVPPTATPVTPAGAAEAAEVIVGDVLDFALSSDDWPGAFGWVQLKIHEATYNGESAWFIRTDASDPAYAQENGLVFVPLLNVARGKDFVNTLYVFDDERPPVIASIPGNEDYISLFNIVQVTVNDASADLSSAEAIAGAAAAVTLEEANVLVNFPLVKWPGGELPVDTALDSYLGTGPLISAPDTEGGSVTFKLHECYPGSRYIITDTSAVPMAPMMGIAPAGPSQQMKELGGADEIWVFGNGIPGSGVMGFQPAIFDNQAGQPAWSPFWDHFTVTWNEGAEVSLLTNSADLRAGIGDGRLTLFNGTPDTDPMGFVVNCPVPIRAPNTFTA
ncbi:MAG: twin-arginine translocation signal domain-containing protein [Verrucomicrobia bacterium]|nr:twin-arginine translocation signal domain-containing protein [Verrucomicrobiota bacterium]